MEVLNMMSMHAMLSKDAFMEICPTYYSYEFKMSIMDKH